MYNLFVVFLFSSTSLGPEIFAEIICAKSGIEIPCEKLRMILRRIKTFLLQTPQPKRVGCGQRNILCCDDNAV